MEKKVSGLEMNRIKILSEELINKIAAGEVVERPASVVKELVENSLDAAASQIDIEIKEGGRKLIRVLDDGIGMGREDVKLAFSRHATSKISGVDDLFNISSLGFRGEALPSIASVSQVEMITRTNGSPTGTKLKMETGEVKEVNETPANVGTIVTVSDLFYNTPARRKFLKSEVTENRHIIDLVTNFALAYPQVSFKLKIDNREVLNLNSTSNLSQRAREIVGKETFSKMLEIKKEPNEIQGRGFLGKPEVAKSSRGEIRFFVNGRIISNRSLSHAVQLGYGELLPKGKYPIVFLFLEISPQLVDVNVHPQKLEVRFANETKKNQWYQELTNLRQATDESIDEYTNKFIKLADRVRINDVAQRKRMYLMGLNPGYTPLVYAQNPADLNAAIDAARRVEIGFNFASGIPPKKVSLSTAATDNPITKAVLDTTPVTNQEVDELTKKLEQLTVNYANLTTALLAQTATLQERRPAVRSTPRTTTTRTSTITCFNCGKQGHIIRECSHPRTPRPQPRRRPRFEEPRDLHYVEYDKDNEYFTSKDEYEVYLHTRSGSYPKKRCLRTDA